MRQHCDSSSVGSTAHEMVSDRRLQEGSTTPEMVHVAHWGSEQYRSATITPSAM